MLIGMARLSALACCAAQSDSGYFLFLVLGGVDEEAETHADQRKHAEACHGQRWIDLGHVGCPDREESAEDVADSECQTSLQHGEHVRGRYITSAHRHADAKLGKQHEERYQSRIVSKLVLPDERDAAAHGDGEADEEGPAGRQLLEEGAHDYVRADLCEARDRVVQVDRARKMLAEDGDHAIVKVGCHPHHDHDGQNEQPLAREEPMPGHHLSRRLYDLFIVVLVGVFSRRHRARLLDLAYTALRGAESDSFALHDALALPALGEHFVKGDRLGAVSTNDPEVGGLADARDCGVHQCHAFSFC